jgi:S-sulfo-L-cysteine synthase (3-phospho-L-serine-dependent)
MAPALAIAGPNRTVVEAMELPRLIEIEPGLVGAAFDLMKLLPARYILDRAEEQGLVDPSTQIVETTSGTFGLGLAMVCRLRGYQLTLVGDPAIDARLARRLRDLGATVSIVRGAALEEGVQQARLARVERLKSRHDNYFVPNQYDNRDNAAAYGVVAELLAGTLAGIDCLVGTVGSGGSTCGTTQFLRTLYPELHLVGVDTPGSVVFGALNGPRLLRGLGSSLVPHNVDHRLFDEIHWVDAATAFFMTRHLYRRHCLFLGPTSGAAFLVAQWWHERHPNANVVVLLPDQGYRYADSVYRDTWLAKNEALASRVPREPISISHPHEASGSWTRISWGRRSRDEVVGIAATS